MGIAFFLAAFASEVIGTIAGFGSSTVFLPLALFFLDFKTALVLVAFLHIFGNLGRVSIFHPHIDKKILLEFGIPSVLFTIMGAFFVSYIPSDMLKGLLGIFLIIYAGYSLLKENFTIPPSAVNAVIGGGLSGFIAGLIGTAGALRAAFLLGFHLPKEKYLATIAATALMVDIARVPVYLKEGFLKSDYFAYLPLLFVVALSGALLGKKIVKRIPQKQFRKMVLCGLAIIGVLFVLEWV